MRGLTIATLLAVALFACQKQKVYPPPVYQRPSLPDWEAPLPEGDPLDTLDLSGEWVEEPSGLGGAAPVEQRSAPSQTAPNAGDPSEKHPHPGE